MVTQTNTSAEINQSATATSDKNSASVSYTNTAEASAGTSVGNKNASVGVEASVKTGTEASAAGGLDGNNVYANASYSSGTEAHVVVDGKVQSNGVGVAGTADAYAVSGTNASANVQAGDKGVAVGAEGSIGNAVGVDASGTALPM